MPAAGACHLHHGAPNGHVGGRPPRRHAASLLPVPCWSCAPGWAGPAAHHASSLIPGRLAAGAVPAGHASQPATPECIAASGWEDGAALRHLTGQHPPVLVRHLRQVEGVQAGRAMQAGQATSPVSCSGEGQGGQPGTHGTAVRCGACVCWCCGCCRRRRGGPASLPGRSSLAPADTHRQLRAEVGQGGDVEGVGQGSRQPAAPAHPPSAPATQP